MYFFFFCSLGQLKALKIETNLKYNRTYIYISKHKTKRQTQQSQQTIIKLAKFNAVLVYCLEFAYGEIVDGVNPMTARKHLFGKARKQGVSAKDFVKKEINCLYSLEEYVKLTKTGLWDKRNMDAYDALVCALYE